jgi:hypothetical protein
MTERFDEEEVAEFNRMEKRAYADHDPELEPHASMSIGQLLEIYNQETDPARILMLEQFLRAKANPRAFLAMVMASKLVKWFLIEYGMEYETAHRNGAVGRAAAAFAMTVIGANDEGSE